MSSDWISADELARRTDLHRVTIYRYAREGTIPCIRGHRAMRFSYEDCIEALEERSRQKRGDRRKAKSYRRGGQRL
ncbi:MAG: helix-turn-helix domain-containing protein [Actinobacteria bacterium]|nr:helix-turn-helix domain-containing protein [Actinomycetota bacterium]